MSIDRTTLTVTAGLVACVMLLAGCGEVNAGRAGGETRDEPRVLTFAQSIDGPPEQLVRWAEEVERLSIGTMKIEFQNAWRAGEVEYEASTITDVADGKVDMAWIGARAFDTVGVESFQALVAPMLVDSHDLQAAVFEAGLPEQMLGGVDELGLVGVGVLPGPMRKLLGTDHPYVTPEDFPGDVIGLQASGVAEQTFTALGATTTRLPGGADIGEVDGYEQQLSSIWGNHYELDADFVTSNLNLWPRPLVIVAGTDVFESLAADQQAVLNEASVNAIPGALEDSRDEDTSGGENLCGAGMTFATASADELVALRSALDPVYSSLAEDPETATYLEAISELKQQVDAPPDGPECGSADGGAEPDAPATIDTSLDGTYTATLTGADIAASGCDSLPWQDPGDEIEFDLTLSDGSLQSFESVNGGDRQRSWIGTYDVFRDQIEIQGDYSIVARWTLDGASLVLSDVDTADCADAVIWTTHPWVPVEATDATTTG